MSEKDLHINGNVVTKPETQEETIKQPKKKKVLKKRTKPEKELKTKNRAGTILTILLLFILGFTTVFASSKVILLQKKYNEKEAELNVLKKENEDLNIKLLKFDNEDYIEGIATSELGMRKAKAEEYISVDLSKDNFNEETTKEEGGKFAKVLNFILGR